MGMFGRSVQKSSDPEGPVPRLTGRDRALIFGAEMLLPGLGRTIRRAKVEEPLREMQNQYMGALAERVRGTPERQVQMPVGNAEGEDISAAFSPQMTTQPGKAPLSINDKDLPGLALRAQQLGIPLDGLLDVLKAQQPSWQLGPDGSPINTRATEAPRAAAVNGIRPTPDGGAEAVRGYADALAGIEGAKTGAQEAAKAGYDMVEVKVGGQTVQLPRSVALPLITAAFGKANPTGLPADFGRTVSPEEQAIRTGRASNTVKQEGMVGDAAVQAQLDLPKVRDQAMTTLGVLDKIRSHPSLSDRTGNSTLLPAVRPRDVDFDVMVSQIGGGAFLEAIQSLKGTGQITEIEGKKATDAIARMQNQRQSQAGFLAAMKDYEDIVRRGVSRTERRARTSAAPARADVEAELRRRGLIR